MTKILPPELGGRGGGLFIHFDVKDHFLKLDTFIETAESARSIIEALGETFFQGSLKYELVVMPPDDGSFLSKLALSIVAGTTAGFAFVNSDVGAAYVEGLTGKTPADWALKIGQDHQEILSKSFETSESIEDDRLETGSAKLPPSVETKAESSDYDCRLTAELVIAMTKGVLEKETSELTKIGMEIGNLPDALDARAEFFVACINDREVKQVGFTADNDFPIPRNAFAERAQKATRKETEDDPPDWEIAVENVYVTSPNWDEEDQRTRQWKGKDQTHRDCYFIIEDAEFWRLVKKKDLHVEVLDILKVQWAYQFVEGRPKNRRVLRVLEFNGNKLAEPLLPDAITSILGKFATLDALRGEPSLFDDLT